jgi:hypothetical protein
LVDFVAAADANSDQYQWVVTSAGTQPVTTPCQSSSPSQAPEQHIYGVITSIGGYLTELDLAMQSAGGNNNGWVFESATVTRIM